VDGVHQSFSGRLFFGSGLCVSRSAPLNFFGGFNRHDTILLGEGTLVLDIQSSLAPTLDRFREFNVEIINVRADADTNAAYIVDDVPRVVAPEVENAFSQAPMRMDAEETLAESNENGNVEDRIRGQLVQLDPVDEKETTKKFVDRSGKTTDEEIDECYPESNRG
jgi:hypothetical protein